MNKELERFLEYYDNDKKKIADMFGVTYGYVSLWIREQCISPQTAVKIEKLTNGLFSAVKLCDKGE